MKLAPSRLFRERALMKLIGYTADQLRAGFCVRGNLADGPMHKNTLGDAVERLAPEEVERIFNGAVRKLKERGFFHKGSGCFALDATEAPTTRKYKGAGVRKHTARADQRQAGSTGRAVRVGFQADGGVRAEAAAGGCG